MPSKIKTEYSIDLKGEDGNWRETRAFDDLEETRVAWTNIIKDDPFTVESPTARVVAHTTKTTYTTEVIALGIVE